MKKVKKIIYVLIILVVVIFILILWNLYKCHGEKIILTGYTKGELIQIEVALMLNPESVKDFPDSFLFYFVAVKSA